MTLALVLFILAWTLAPPAQRFFVQRAQISAIRAQVSANNQALVDAARELEMWRDPEYIKSQARERLHFVLPGEREYIVTDGTQTAVQDPTTAVAKDIPSGLPWYNRLIASITETGAP
jgi:cell division protein FtsB